MRGFRAARLSGSPQRQHAQTCKDLKGLVVCEWSEKGVSISSQVGMEGVNPSGRSSARPSQNSTQHPRQSGLPLEEDSPHE